MSALLLFYMYSFGSVVMPNLCKVTAEVENVKSQGETSEILLIKVLKKEETGTANEPCNYISTGKHYKAFIKNKYNGKYLRVPPLTPGKLKAGSIFKATTLHNSGSKKIHWSLLKNNLSLPVETSFQTSLTE